MISYHPNYFQVVINMSQETMVEIAQLIPFKSKKCTPAL